MDKRIHFSPEISLGQIIVALSFAGTVIAAYKDLSVDVALIKNAQAVQVETNNTIRGEIREVRQEVRKLDASVRERPMRGM